MGDLNALSYYGSSIRERRRVWEEKKAESPETYCDEFAYSCKEALFLASGTDYRGFNCRCINKARAVQEKKQAAKQIEAALRRFGELPQGLLPMTFENYVQIPEWRHAEADSALHALKVCLNYADDQKRLPFLTIFGPVGAGKTHLAMAIAQVIDLVPTWANCPELFEYLRSTFDDDVKATFHREFERIKTAQLLVLDDQHAEYETPWATEQMYQIINHRHINQLPTVITTNADVLKMSGRIGSRIRDSHTGQLVRLDVSDNRLRLRRR